MDGQVLARVTRVTKSLRLSSVLPLVALFSCSTTSVSAHVFVQPYTLPVPFWMYLYACAATLVLSFAVVAYVVSEPTSSAAARGVAIRGRSAAARLLWTAGLSLGRAVALACLLVTILGGFIGTGDPRANINLTLFWVGFLLGFTYVTALVGNAYTLVNPWLTLVALLERAGLDLSRPRLRYPVGLGYLPALLAYVALIWIELFTLPRPLVLSTAALVYTAVTLGGTFLFGKHAWFTFGELFAVFFHTVGMIAPIELGIRDLDGPGVAFATDRPVLRLRVPFTATGADAPIHPTYVLFVLFMLSSTTYDAVHQTFLWVSLYWKGILPMVTPLWGGDMVAAQVSLTEWYQIYQYAGLLLSPFLYLALYLLVLAAATLVTGTRAPVWTLAGRFVPSLIPIALVYHATHYATILIADFPRLWPLASDPFGLGWQIFPATAAPVRPLDMGLIWHSQVALVLGGHVAGVYMAHKTAVGAFSGTRHSVLSQLPMLVLMVAYTCVGLWVLSLPLDVPQVLPIE